jgi:putative peptidoglycan lipid II flippase
LSSERANQLAKEGPKAPTRSGSVFVAAGILLSRIAGLIRQKVFAHYFGNSAAGDAFFAALKIPNFLQNLLGDGVLSASFIPVYAKLHAENRGEEADQVAGAIGSLLGLLASLFSVLGVIFTPDLIDLIAPGFEGEKRELTIHLVRIFFPGTGLLVLSAWCLGILNSHRRFFLSYVAPVFWNLTFIAALIWFGPRNTQNELAVNVAWGVLLGSALQFGFQFPTVLKVAPALGFKVNFKSRPLREIFKNLLPVVFSRGAVQVSAYIDNILASYLPTGAVVGLGYAQMFYLLPISLFGMSISAAELTTMSSVVGSEDEVAAHLRQRLMSGLRHISYFVIPSAVAFLAIGDSLIGGIYQGGKFGRADTLYVWGILAGSTVGLLATTQARLYSSAFYSLKDTRSPVNFALIRVALTTTLGYYCGLHLPRQLGIAESWGAAGLTASAGLSGWVEYLLLKRKLSQRIGATRLPLTFLTKLWLAAIAAGAAGVGMKVLIGYEHPLLALPIVVSAYGLIYVGTTMALKVEESHRFLHKITRRLKRR